MGEVMKYFIKFFKKFVLGGFLLYAYNIIAVSFNLTIPINFITIITVSIFDFFGLIALVLLKTFGL